MSSVENILITVAFFVAATIIIISVLNFILKMRIIQSTPLDENVLKFLKNISDFGRETLKWGIIMFFGGISLILIDFLPEDKVTNSTIPYGIVLIFLSLGFLVYYLVIRNKK